MLNVAADAESNQYGKAGKKVGTEIITELGARVVENKTKSNLIKAAYEALSSWFDNTVND